MSDDLVDGETVDLPEKVFATVAAQVLECTTERTRIGPNSGNISTANLVYLQGASPL